MKIIINKYQDLSSDKLYEILKLRSEVFVVEQNCAYQDLDNKDQKALHLIVEEKNKIIAEFKWERGKKPVKQIRNDNEHLIF